MAEYSETKDSGIEWIGRVPVNWKIERGKNILTLLNRPVDEDDEIITCFRDGEVTLRKNRRVLGFTNSLKEIGYQGINVGDLVVHGMDGFAGAIGISDSKGKATPVLNVLESTQNKRYLMYYLRSLAFRDVFMSLSTGIRVRSCDLRWNKLATLPFILPSDEEQAAIVTYLDEQCEKIDAVLNETKNSMEEYKNWKYSIISETISKGLVSAVGTQTTGLSSFTHCPATWKIMRIKDISCILRGGSPRPIDAFLTDSSEGYNWIKIGDTVKGRKIITSTKQKIRPEGLSKTRLVHKGDLLLTNSMSFGQPYILGIDGCIHDGWVCLSNIKCVSREFLYYFLCSELCMMQFHLQVTGGVVQNLNVEKIGNTKIFVPSVSEQNEIVAYLEQRCQSIEALIDEKESIITDLNNYKKSLIYETVTGKRKVVKTWPTAKT